MKVKQRPEDFRVEEVSRLEAGAEGEYCLYRLSKSGIGTPEAVRIVVRSWRLRRPDVGFAGLKDRHAVTGQMLSIRRGPTSNFEGKGFKLNYLGRSPRPAGRGTIEKNRFRIVLRDLSADDAGRVVERARAAAENGFPDYYDDQRFGSLRGTGGRFVAEALLAGDGEEALRLAIACPARKDRSRIKQRRKLLSKRWGEWGELAAELDTSLEREMCGRLAEGASFADAYRMLDPALRSIHLAAYQARLFNEELRQRVPAGPSHPGVAGPYRFYEGDPGDLRDQRIELFTDERLAFRAGSRGAVAFPGDLDADGPSADDLNPGRHRATLAFTLRPGSYATMLVKRCVS